MLDKMRHRKESHNNLLLVADRVIRNGYSQKWYFCSAGETFEGLTRAITPEVAVSLKAKRAKSSAPCPSGCLGAAAADSEGMVNVCQGQTVEQPICL